MSPARSIAYLFGGQGPELPRIGADLAQEHASAHELMQTAARVAGVDLIHLLRQGHPRLYHTEVQQPAMVAAGLAVVERLRAAGLRPTFTAGYSLGEITAWAATGALDPQDAIVAASARGRLMAGLAAARPGGMLYVECADEEGVRSLMEHGRRHGEVSIAAHNCPGEWTISGEAGALAAVSLRHPARKIQVEGAWHSGMMADGLEEMEALLAALPRRPAEAGFLCNRTGEAVGDEAGIPRLIAGQLTHPIQWTRTLETLARSGVTAFIVIGAGKFLRSLARKTLGPEAVIHTTETLGDLARTLREMQ
jgi:[acyl-carrier-protein] S-malonyltransferase